MARCPKCRKENPETARFCRSCGQALAAEAGQEAYAPTMLTAGERARRLLEEAFRLSEEGGLQAAIRACQQAIGLNPTSTSAHSLLGTLYERIGDRDGAIREYEQVLTLSPGSTVERRRLNELMGVPTAAPPGAVSRRTARLALAGGSGLVAVVVLAALIFTSQQRAEQPKEWFAGGAARGSTRGPAAAGVESVGELPPRLLSLGRVMPGVPVRRQQAMQTPRRTSSPQQRGGFGQWVAPGAFLMPAGGSEGYFGLDSAQWQPRRIPAPRSVGARPVTGGGPPTVGTPSWRYPSPLEEAGAAVSPRLARNYYFQGDHQRAIDAYRGYLSQHPDAGAAPREELAWVYAEAGDRRRASGEYRTALSQYQNDLNRGHNLEAARHGVRTCESAIRAFETE